ncbi:MAG: phytase [Bacteroidota bacterium]
MDDEKEFKQAMMAQSLIPNRIKVDIETDPVSSEEVDEDAADDPAIWVNPKDPGASIVFGSNKTSGIHTYDLSGKEVQNIPCGLINNVDVRQGVNFNGKIVDILAGSNRTDNSILAFFIDTNGKIGGSPDFKFSLGEFIPYGFCLSKDSNNKVYFFVNDKEGNIFQIDPLIPNVGKTQSGGIIRKMKLPSQVEGMVVDDENEVLFVGEENAGIYKFSSNPEGDTKGTLIPGSNRKNPNIRFDIEGLALIGSKYLVASSQGNFSYAIFDVEQSKYLLSFCLDPGKVDGVEETDGIEICTVPLGPKFPNGIFVAQDGFNYNNEEKLNQNFKFVNLGEITTFLQK